MKRLVLLRHSKTVTSAAAGDHARGLAPRGCSDAPAAGLRLKALATPDLVLVSDARRTRETFDLVVEAFGRALPHRFEPRLYGASADEILGAIVEAPDDVRTLLVIGHNPGIGDLARRLSLTAAAPDPRRDLDQRFPTSAFAVIDLTAPDWSGAGQGGRLEAFVMPHE